MRPASAGGSRRAFKRPERTPADTSELQATLAGGVGQGLDPAMVTVAGTVEGDLLDAGGLGLFGDRLADLRGGLGVAAVLQAVAHVGLGGAGRGQHLRAVGAEYLRIQVLAGAQHRQARHVQFADARAGGAGAAQAGVLLVHGLRSLLEADRRAGFPALCLLGFLADDVLAGVLHALALVGLRRSVPADLRGDLADLLLVGAGDQDLGLGRRGDGDAVRDREHHRVRKAQGQVQVLALHRGTVAHAHQLELALEAFGHAADHVVHDRADGAGYGHVRRFDRGEHDVAVLDLDLHAFRPRDRQGALRALHANFDVLDVDLDALGQGNRLLGNTGHAGFSLKPRSTGLRRRRPAGAPAHQS